MNVYVNEITGVADAIVSMYMSKRTWSRELESEIRRICKNVFDNGDGRLNGTPIDTIEHSKFVSWIERLSKWGQLHTTLLRFIDLSVTVEGLHRGGQDDWDSHAKRFNNRIIRSSTRLSSFDAEMSEWYQGKIIPTDVALTALGLSVPKTITIDNANYVRTINGYIREELADDKDVKRGLYMLSIPSNFIFKCDITEYGHVFKERERDSSAAPEVKLLAEEIVAQTERLLPWFNREFFLKIKN